MLYSVLAISLGAAFGATSRWLLGLGLNSLFPTIPPGTLLANMLGGYIIGLALTFFAANPDLPPEWKLFVVTGFLGALTTFSTFSAEVTSLLQQGKLGWACCAVGVHVVGSLCMTLLGMGTMHLLQRA